ncbi:MAG: hypothetical protein HY665_03075 [Chloroflexi bacterium]|nr:hypothetical protein [Chloroflexota bacterium]
MTDELDQKEGTKPQSDGSVPDVESKTRVAELESLVTQKDSELVKAKARLTELEQAVATGESEMAGLKQARAELEEKLKVAGASVAEAVGSYRAMVVQANPEVVGELISGDTIAAIDDSLKQAKALVSRVRQGIEAELSSARIPAGAPERTSPDLSALSPREKIQYAIKKSP